MTTMRKIWMKVNTDNSFKLALVEALKAHGVVDDAWNVIDVPFNGSVYEVDVTNEEDCGVLTIYPISFGETLFELEPLYLDATTFEPTSLENRRAA